MKSKEEIEYKLVSISEEILYLTKERAEKKEKMGGISDEENEDYLSDITHLTAKMKILEWVLS
jgi:hypothetical protein